MPIRNVATLAVAIFLGIVAVVLVRNYVGTVQQGAPVATGAMAPVVVVTQAVARGTAIQPAMLKIVDYPRDSAPPGAFSDLSQVTGAQQGPRVALRALTPNEPLHAANVSAPGLRLDLSEAVSGGMRAVSLRSNDVVGVAGFVLPGDRVDILLTRQTGERGESVTQVLAENVMVLGVDQSDNDQETKPAVAKAVTVEVTADQAELISLGRAVGEISLTLRHATDDKPLIHRAMTVADLAVDLPRRPAAARQAPRVAPPAPPPPAPPPPPTVVRVIRGVDASFYEGTESSLAAVGRVATPTVLPPAVVRP